MVEKNLIDSNVEPVADKLHRLTRAVLGAVPFGGTATELFNAIVTPPVEARRNRWMASVTDELNDLLNKDLVTWQEIENNPRFFSVLIAATVAAQKTDEQVKLMALRNAVRSAARSDKSEEVQTMYVRYLGLPPVL